MLKFDSDVVFGMSHSDGEGDDVEAGSVALCNRSVTLESCTRAGDDWRPTKNVSIMRICLIKQAKQASPASWISFPFPAHTDSSNIALLGCFSYRSYPLYCIYALASGPTNGFAW